MILSFLAAAALAAHAPATTISSGVVIGSARGDVNAFLGIPYAAPPVGALRWKPPQPAAALATPLDATKYGAACTQPEDKTYGLTPPVQDESCLFLNVWAPAHAKNLPVMVWLHGGSNRMGAGSLALYDGGRLAARGVVVVTINYRIGYLGFFAHDALAGENNGGNFGLMDQVAALKWVQANIAAFGGDPARVTAFGESAGGGDLLYLMTMPAAAGLFSAAIVQSGGGWHKAQPPEKTRAAVLEDFEKAGIDAASADALRALDARKLVAAHTLRTGFGPWLDGVTVSQASWRAFEAGTAAPVPLIIGSNSWEANFMKARGFGFIGKLLSFLPSVYGWYGDRAKDSAERQDLLFRDAVFEAPARWIAQQHSAKQPTWLYMYGHITQGRKGQAPGAGHAAEIAYVFDNLDSAPQAFAGASDADRTLAHALADCWAAFARDHKPSCALPEWKSYDATRDELLWIEDDVKFEKHPDAAILDGVREKFGPGGLFGS